MASICDRFFQRLNRRILYAAALGALTLNPGVVLAETFTCPGQDITVDASSTALANKVCSVAAKSRALLASCHLRQTEPFLIEVIHRLPPGFEECFGVYHCNNDLVQVLDPDALSDASRRTGTFGSLPADVLFDSLLVHEISHVYAYQSRLGPPQTIAEVEYIAYAMQLESLPAAARDTLLTDYPVVPPVSLMELNDIILSFSPEVFAVKAWTHFRTEGNGCGFIRSILEQKADFPAE